MTQLDVPDDEGRTYDWNWIAHPFWSDWLLRFVYCRYWLRASEDGSTARRLSVWGEHLNDLISGRYGPTPPIEFRLPEISTGGAFRSGQESFVSEEAPADIIINLMDPKSTFERVRKQNVKIEYGESGDRHKSFAPLDLYPGIAPDNIKPLTRLNRQESFVWFIRGRDQSSPLAIALNVVPVTAFPWEAAIYEDLPASAIQSWREQPTYRTLTRPERSTPEALNTDWRRRDVCILISAETAHQRDLNRALNSQNTEIFPLNPREIPSYAVAMNQRVIYLIGRPTQTTSGLQLHFGEDSSNQPARKSIQSRGTLRPPAAILARGHRRQDAYAPLIILQLPPEEIVSRLRSDSDREHIAALKQYGAEVFAGGAYAVLVLPSLPMSMLSSVLQDLDTIPQSPSLPSTAMLATFAARIRQRIADYDTSLSPLFEELALDVCLYTTFTPPIDKESLP